MTEVTLAKATLTRLTQTKGAGKDAPTTYTPDGKPFTVQLNPTSLKLTRQNNLDKGKASTHGQRHQFSSPQPATLAFDLEFDTAEVADPAKGRHADVRTLTRIVRQFVEPTHEKPKDSPPAILFSWGTFLFQGIVTSLTEDLDLFSPAGVPLRAKVAIVITEQDPAWEAHLTGPGARDDRATRIPGGGELGAGPGSAPATNPTSVTPALSGESVQQALARLNADPAAWRSAMAGLTSPLGLAAGAQVQVAAAASAGAGLGVSGGFAAGAQASATAGLAGALGGGAGAGAGAGAGLGAGASGGASAGASFGASAAAGAGFSAGAAAGAALGVGASASGFALAEAGGVAAAALRVDGAAVAGATASARASFEVTAGPTAGFSAGASAQAATPSPGGTPAPPPPVDRRALGYGAGVPLTLRVDLARAARDLLADL